MLFIDFGAIIKRKKEDIASKFTAPLDQSNTGTSM
jgi:hypothetical protein